MKRKLSHQIDNDDIYFMLSWTNFFKSITDLERKKKNCRTKLSKNPGPTPHFGPGPGFKNGPNLVNQGA